MSEQLKSTAEAQISTEQQELLALVWNLKKAKEAEEAKKQQRIKIEEAIAALVPGPDIGQKTVKLDDNTSITVKRGFNYKADCEAILKLELENTPVKTVTTRKLDEKGYEYYREQDVETFNKLSEFVTVTPKKVAVEVKKK